QIDLQECEDELAGLEGPNGTLSRYFQAVRLLETRGDVQEAARQADQLLSEIDAVRPHWPQSRLLRGRIAELTGLIDDAVENYEIALRAGARSLASCQWLGSTLSRKTRFADAAAYIRQVGQIATLSGEFSSQAVPAN